MSNETTAENAAEKSLTLHRIFTKNSLFEATQLSLEMLEAPVTPAVEIQVGVNFSPRQNNLFEAVLSLNLTAKHDGSLLWRIQLQQAGLFTLKGIEEEQQKQVLNGYCMNLIYPYTHPIISNMITQAGFRFDPAFLAPMDFDNLYRQQQAQEAKKTAVTH